MVGSAMGLAEKTGGKYPDLAVVDGWGINLSTLDDAVAAVCSAAKRRESFALFTLNLDHLVKLRSDAAFRAAYGEADFVTADGAPVAAFARRQGNDIERTTGADLVEPLCDAAAGRDLPVYLFGTTQTVLRAAQAHLSARTAGRLTIAGMDSPPLSFDPEGADADRAIDRIAASGARICFVALGAPRQELFAARARERGIKVGFICIGAALDFLAGAQHRAPVLMQDWKLEWLWRLATNPRRLGARYALCALLLFEMLFLKPVAAGPGTGNGVPE